MGTLIWYGVAKARNAFFGSTTGPRGIAAAGALKEDAAPEPGLQRFEPDVRQHRNELERTGATDSDWATFLKNEKQAPLKPTTHSRFQTCTCNLDMDLKVWQSTDQSTALGSLGRMTSDLYRKRPGGQTSMSETKRRPGRFGSSRKKEAAPNLAGQLLIGYSIAIVIRDETVLLLAVWPHNC